MKVVVTVDGAAVGFFVRLAAPPPGSGPRRCQSGRQWRKKADSVCAAAAAAAIASVLLGRFARKPAMDIWALSHLGRFRDAALIRRVMNTRIVAAVKALVVAAGK